MPFVRTKMQSGSKILRPTSCFTAVFITATLLSSVCFATPAHKVRNHNENTSATDGSIEHWGYSSNTDAMGVKSFYACLKSINSVSQNFPYKPTRVRICIFTTGGDNFLTVGNITSLRVYLDGNGQIVGDHIKFRFDEHSPLSFAIIHPDDGVTNLASFKWPKEVSRLIGYSKKMYLRIDLFGSGLSDAEFDVSGLKVLMTGKAEGDVEYEKIENDYRELKYKGGSVGEPMHFVRCTELKLDDCSSTWSTWEFKAKNIPQLGFQIATITPEILQGLTYNPHQSGVYVTAVTPGAPAAGAGIHVGDTIGYLDGRAIKSVEDFEREFGSAKPGASVELSGFRGFPELHASIKVGG